MSYVDKNIDKSKNEKLLVKAKKSPWYLMTAGFPLIILALVALALMFLCNFISTIPFIKRFGADKVFSVLDICIWAVCLGVGVIIFLVKLVGYLSIDLAVTNKRVIGKIGFLRVNLIDIPIEKVDNVQLVAGLWGRMFRYYRLYVSSVSGAGLHKPKENKQNFIGISNAQEFKQITTRAIEQHAEEARKALAKDIAVALIASHGEDTDLQGAVDFAQVQEDGLDSPVKN